MEKTCCVGFFDMLVILMLVVLINLLVPILGWGSFAFPLAFLIDIFFGDMMHGKRFRCDEETGGSTCRSSEVDDTMFLFVSFLACFLFFYLLRRTAMYERRVDQPKYCTNKSTQNAATYKGLVNFLTIVFGSLFTFTFLPWFIHDYLKHTPPWMQIGILVVSAVVWFFLPVLRRYSSLVILVYCFSYVIYWHVYDETLLWVQHTTQLFLYLLNISMIILGSVAFTGDSYLHIVHIYNRWRLQKAFYTKKSVGTCGCAGICCYNCFPGTHFGCKIPESNGSEGALSLHHLKGVKPQYISNVVVNGWRKEVGKPKYQLLTMSSEGIGLIDSQPRNDSGEDIVRTEQPLSSLCNEIFVNKLEPGDIKLSSAMAISAAALSPHLGTFVQEEQAFTHILTILGLEMAATIVYDIASERTESLFSKYCFWIIKLPLLVLIIFPILHLCNVIGDSPGYLLGIGTFYVLMLLLSVLTCPDKACSRWLYVHEPLSRYMRSMFEIVHTGPRPPAMLHLSDGGHFENLGILPLLKLRLKKIVVVNGGYVESDSRYGDDLVHALELAREILNCSFVSMDGDDVLADIKEKFVKSQDGKCPRNYEFKVHYYEKENEESARKKVGEGHVVLIAPRHPRKGLPSEDVSWRDLNLDLEAGLWGDGPVLKSNEVDRLTFCCCACCHGDGCPSISKIVCGAFPQHFTCNQFFTPEMFSAYHREGYRACMEAIDDFLKIE